MTNIWGRQTWLQEQQAETSHFVLQVGGQAQTDSNTSENAQIFPASIQCPKVWSMLPKSMGDISFKLYSTFWSP